MKKTSILLTIITTTLITACGGSGSGASGSSNPSNVGSDNSSNLGKDSPKVEQTEHPKVALTEQNVEALSRDAVDFLMQTTRDAYYDLEDVAHSINKEVFANANGGLSHSVTLDCERGGTWSISYANGPTGYSDSQGDAVYGEGATLSTGYNNCGSSYLQAPYLLSGFSSSAVESGLYDGFSVIAPDTRISGRIEHLVVYVGWEKSKKDYGDYSHGDVTSHYADENNVAWYGEFLAAKDSRAYYFDKDYQLHNYSFSMRKVPGKYSWNGETYLSTTVPFELDLVNENVRLSIEITEDLLYKELSTDHEAGKVIVRSALGVLELTFNGDYVDYRLDADEDNDFEITGMIDGASMY